MVLSKVIKILRINSFLLFIIPSIAIFGSLQIHNSLIDSKYELQKKNVFLPDKPGEKYNLKCTEDNGYCTGKKAQQILNKNTEIGECNIFIVNETFVDSSGKKHPRVEGSLPSTIFTNIKNNDGSTLIQKEFLNDEFLFQQYVTNKKDETCIKNYKISYFFYKYFFPYTYILDEKIKGIELGTQDTVNPFLYGEVSISNLVKRHPINIFFKFFLYIGVILMIAYWYNYNKIFKKILDKKINLFYLFGLASAIFLFFHVYFLGTTSSNEILKDFRRIVIVLFILFEVFAQTFLAYKIYTNRNVFNEYCYKSIVLTKVFFVSIILVFTIAIMTILSIFNLPSSVDYILEWNYFIVLLVFYLLSSLMWKKKIN
ncbi:hypothetical protein N9T25_01480 [Candidatus Pelagibacter sp.]|nr:hypothetical protein [Candidatus Pelagibacter sp.]